MKILALISILFLTGCASFVPNTIRTEVEHVSHPFAGPPFGPINEEDGLSQFNVLGRWRVGERGYVEQGFGINLQGKHGGGFYGPALTYTGRAGIEFTIRE